MALFEGEEIEYFEETNEYLDNPQKGIELIKSLLMTVDSKKVQTEFDMILNNKVFPIIAELELKNETEIYRTFQKISDKIKEQKKIQLLLGKTVVGIGGKFSAGKSCFINSITNAMLPEGQRPTTSIATYIINSEKAANIAITNSDESVQIDDVAVEALTHEFYEKYNIGFSKILKNLVVYTPEFTYPNIAILDTPGYSKSDSNKSDDSSDAELAREQLKTVDYLIWLVDANQGAITQRDLDFITSLNINSEILIVFTKSSQRTEDELRKIVDEAKLTLKSANQRVYDVIAYDSFEKTEILSKGVLQTFFEKINSCEKKDDNIQEIMDLGNHLLMQIKEEQSEVSNYNKDISEVILKTINIEHINSLLNEYIKNKTYIDILDNQKKQLEICVKDLISAFTCGKE